MPVAEIIEIKDIQRARARRREHALTQRCLAIMEECLAITIVAYHAAEPRERLLYATKIRTLEDLIAYTASLP
jgi:hypothetical protein